jgi:hypothetical protein
VSVPVRTTPEADAQILEIDTWWRRNRHASPNLFADELAASFDIIGHAPNIGWNITATGVLVIDDI